MAGDDTRRYSINEVIGMNKRGDYVPTPVNAPTIELDDGFWENAQVIVPQNKQTISLRVDPEVLDWFKSQGKGHLTRMNAVLRSYVDAKKRNPAR